MMEQFRHIEGLRVVVDELVYMPSLHSPPDKPHPFIYYITIYNDSEEAVQILGRKWLVKESDGACVIIEGNGVIGETPLLNPGENFSYNSYHVVARSAEASGALYGIIMNTDGVKRFMVQIPELELKCP